MVGVPLAELSEKSFGLGPHRPLLPLEPFDLIMREVGRRLGGLDMEHA